MASSTTDSSRAAAVAVDMFRGNSADELSRAQPLVDLAGEPQICWQKHGFALFPADDDCIQLASAVRERATLSKLHQMSTRLDHQTQISGKVVQTPLSSLPASSDADGLQSRFRSIVSRRVRQLVRRWGKYGYARDAFAGAQILVAAQGVGDQALHFDSDRSVEDQSSRCAITALLYCSAAHSTRMPRFTKRFFTDRNSKQPELQHFAKLLDDRFFHSVPVEAGQLLLFLHAIPHAGVACTTKHPRVVLFDAVLRPCGMDGFSTEMQFFSWNYARFAFGDRSPEFRSALLANMEHDPIGREIDPDERASLRVWLGLPSESSEKDDGLTVQKKTKKRKRTQQK